MNINGTTMPKTAGNAGILKFVSNKIQLYYDAVVK